MPSDGQETTECWCCGGDFPSGGLLRLRAHPEVAICADCAGGLRSKSRALIRAVPVLTTDTVSESSRFWSAAGFEVHAYGSDFVSAYRDAQELHLVGPRAGRDRGGAYLHVREPDAEHAAWRAAGLAVSDVRDEPWGMREFNVTDPGGNFVRIGRAI